MENDDPIVIWQYSAIPDSEVLIQLSLDKFSMKRSLFFLLEYRSNSAIVGT